MPILLLILLLGTLAYLFYQRRTTTLTRACRWRKSPDGWQCVSCGAQAQPGPEPRHCGR